MATPTIVLPSGAESHGGQLKPAGHGRREQMRKRTDKLERAAEILTKDHEIYAIDRAKLEEEPEILKHFNFQDRTFDVSNAKKGFVYYWERDDSRAVSWRKGQARVMLGPNFASWEVVSGHAGQCSGGHACKCEATEVIQSDGTRKIGDVVLMRIPLDSYILIQKRQTLMNRFRTSNIAQKLSDFVRENEGLVQVHTIENQTPREYFAKQGMPLVHTSSQQVDFPTRDALAGKLVGVDEE